MLQLNSQWELTSTQAGEYASAEALPAASLKWLPAIVPGTAAQSLQAINQWSFDNPRDFDDFDWWYKTSFTHDSLQLEQLVFNGLATVADVWLNNTHILSASNMFVRYECDVAETLREQNTLVICFRSINSILSQRHPRPGWKTRLVKNQNLRFIRTTLLGRIPGWTPPVAAVGPWQSILFSQKSLPKREDIFVSTNLQDSGGVVSLKLSHQCDNAFNVELVINNKSYKVETTYQNQTLHIDTAINIDAVEPWWPHTHGKPVTYAAVLNLSTDNFQTSISLGNLGFKAIKLDQQQQGFTLYINNKAVFCRGACWTVNDIVSLNGDANALEKTLTLLRDAGANMIRIGGTMIYEQDIFHTLCDQLGILVWQDFMFANMDYPTDSADFSESVEQEITQQVIKLGSHVSTTVLCGNSEIEQQVAMLGMTEEQWTQALFHQTIPTYCSQSLPHIPYVSSTPTGGTLPFHTSTGLSHYYGVGAYLESVSQVRNHNVKFTSECLGFSNIPVTRTRNKVLSGDIPVIHDPRWKLRTPRDSGTGWDFEDVRDHYLQELFDVNPVDLRSFNPELYLRLSELTTGEIMQQVFSEWRSNHSHCSGGLVWFLKDFWAGAGWGIIDSYNIPKACYYYLKRSWQNCQISLTNETINGIDIHISNESNTDLNGKLDLYLLSHQGSCINRVEKTVQIPASGCSSLQADSLLGRFTDIAYSYRFGPAAHSLVYARFTTDDNLFSSSNYLFTQHIKLDNTRSELVTVNPLQINETTYQLSIKSKTFLYAVNIETAGFIADDNFFCLLPDEEVKILLKTDDSSSRFKGQISAFNLDDSITFRL